MSRCTTHEDGHVYVCSKVGWLDDVWKPVAFASRTMSATECHYAQIEKEALAATWACHKFSDYLIDHSFLIETDHKPLVSLLGTKGLDNLPRRILSLWLRLSRFDHSIQPYLAANCCIHLILYHELQYQMLIPLMYNYKWKLRIFQ